MLFAPLALIFDSLSSHCKDLQQVVRLPCFLIYLDSKTDDLQARKQDKIEVLPLSQFAKCAETRDLHIFSLTLSQLSYRGSGYNIRQSPV